MPAARLLSPLPLLVGLGACAMTPEPGKLPHALQGERLELSSPATGTLSYYRSAPSVDAPALLLVHSVNAAASAYEVKPLYEHYAATRTVYALDLPGFGFSDRSRREYTPRLMTDAVHSMVEEIARRHGGGPVDALALSLSSEFLARAAGERPQAYRSVALVSPTGFSGDAPLDGPPGSTRGRARLHGVFTFPLLEKPFWYLLNSRPSARYFLEKTWGSKDIDEGLLAYDYLSSHQPGAWNAPYYFVSGFLFSADMDRVYDALEMPVWLPHGVRGDFVDYRRTERVAGRPNWRVEVFQTGALPHFEMLEAFTASYDRFLQQAP